MDLDLYFLQDPSTDSSGTAAAAAKYFSGTAIKNVRDLVVRVLGEIAKTGGKIRTLTIMGHGLDDPSGDNDPAMFIHIGADTISLDTITKYPDLLFLTEAFQR